MDFEWNDVQRDFYERALEFTRTIPPRVEGDDWNGARFPTRGWKRCAGFGLTGLSVPEQLGGLGLDALSTAHVLEACGRGLEDSGLLFSLSAHLFAVVMPIVEHASENLRNAVVPELASGRAIGANAITEPDAGSDTSRLGTRAERDGDVYRITGEKCFITNAPVADYFLVYATTQPRAGYLGQSAFVVRRETPGLEVGAAYSKTGLESAPLASVFLDGCLVPVSQRIGADGQGARIFARSMAWERACLFAGFVGAMERSLDKCIAYAQQRRQYGAPIARLQSVSHRIADMKRRLESARLLVYHACWKHDRGMDATLEISLAKLAVSEAAVESGIDAIRVHGGIGYMKESGVDRELLDGIGSTIFSGTSDIQRELIAHRLLERSASRIDRNRTSHARGSAREAMQSRATGARAMSSEPSASSDRAELA